MNFKKQFNKFKKVHLTLDAEHLAEFQSGTTHFAQGVDDALGVLLA